VRVGRLLYAPRTAALAPVPHAGPASCPFVCNGLTLQAFLEAGPGGGSEKRRGSRSVPEASAALLQVFSFRRLPAACAPRSF
jgi:hypothetical protein